MQFFHTVRHLFVPHASNNHRSKILHLDALFAYILFFAVINFGFQGGQKVLPDVLGYATDINVEQLLERTNSERVASGLNQLTLNSVLSEAAAKKAQDMFAKGYWAHNSPTGATPWDFITASGYKYVVAGENLAKNFSTSQAVVTAWKASPTHWANIIKPSYKEIGFAVVNGKLNGEETTLVVQMFGTSTDAIATKPETNKEPVLLEKALAVDQAPSIENPVRTESLTSQPPPSNIAGSTNSFSSVLKTPAINIPTLSRDIVFVFAGVLMGVLLLDAWIVSKKKIVRVAGHNIAHFLFLSAIVILAGSIGRGALL